MAVEHKISPYTEFTNWLLNPMPNVELKDHVLKVINPRSCLCMFGKIGAITIFLNEHFNNFSIMELNRIEFYRFLKVLVQKFKLQRSDFSFFANEKIDKSLTELQSFFPQLKRYEISTLLELVKEDPEYDSFLESLGLRKQKMTKLKVSKKKDTSIKEKKEKVSKKDNKKESILTFSSLKDQFFH